MPAPSTYHPPRPVPAPQVNYHLTLPAVKESLTFKPGHAPHVPIVTGFLGRGLQTGAITTLGRGGGSDLTCTLLGAALGLPEVQVWKDVDGVLTADPRVVAAATPVSRLTFEQATELAVFGAMVLHPLAMQPAQEGNVGVRVKNSYNRWVGGVGRGSGRGRCAAASAQQSAWFTTRTRAPSSPPQLTRPCAHAPTPVCRTAPGTLIAEGRDMADVLVTSIVIKSNVTLVDINSTRMMGQYGFLAKVGAAGVVGSAGWCGWCVRVRCVPGARCGCAALFRPYAGGSSQLPAPTRPALSTPTPTHAHRCLTSLRATRSQWMWWPRLRSPSHSPSTTPSERRRGRGGGVGATRARGTAPCTRCPAAAAATKPTAGRSPHPPTATPHPRHPPGRCGSVT